MIAIATHGRAGLHHLLMGSVTEQVLDHTKLPLLVIHSHGQEAHAKAEFPTEEASHVGDAEKSIQATQHVIRKRKTPIPDLDGI